MKILQTLNGGYKRHMDYLLTLQSEILGVQNALFKNLGHDLVLSGCEVTDHLNGTVSISPGVVYVDGEIVRFAGASNIPSNGTKALIKGAAVLSDPDEFFDGGIKNTYREVFAVVDNTVNSAIQIVIGANLYNIRAYISDIISGYGVKGEIKDIYDTDGTFLSNFDETGLGVTPRWLGWARVNNNNGTPDGAGRVRVNAGKIVDISDGVEHTFTNGQTGGEVRHKQTVPEMPVHSHGYQKMRQSNNVDAGSNTRYGELENATTSTTGEGRPMNNMQPFLGVYSVMRII